MSSCRKKRELIDALKENFGEKDWPSQKFPCTRLADEIYTVVELSEEEIFIAAKENVAIVTREHWLTLFALLKKHRITAMCLVECEVPWKFVLYDSIYRVTHINTRSGVVRRVQDDRGTLVRQYLLRVVDDVVIFRNTENDVITEIRPFQTDRLLATSWFTGLTQDGTGLCFLARTNIPMTLHWQYQGQTVPLYKLPELAQLPGLIATVSTNTPSGANTEERVEIIRNALSAGDSLQVNKLPDRHTTVCTMPLNSTGKKIIVILSLKESLVMLCRPQTEYSEFALFRN